MNLIWSLAALLVSLTLSIFYRKYKIRNKDRLLKKAPMVIVSNHPNAFMDSIVLSLFGYPGKYYFLARGDVFRSKIAVFFYENLRIAPIYRMQDEGKEGLKKNDETYRRVNRLLKRKKKIVVYAEGICVQERRLRPLKKGVARMVLGAMEEMNDPDFAILPTGLNYSDPKRFRSTVFLNVGEPIKVSDYMEEYHQNPARAMNRLLHDLYPKMKELIIHINDPKNDAVVGELEELHNKEWLIAQGLDPRDLENEYHASKHIVEKVNTAAVAAPQQLEAIREKSNAYFAKLKALQIKDWVVDPTNDRRLSWPLVSFRCLLLVIGFPVYFRGVLGNYLPYRLSDKITKKIAKNVEFYASLNIGLGSFLFLFFYLLQFFIAYLLAPHIGWALIVILASLFTGLFSLYYHSFRQRTKGLLRMLKNKTQLDSLRKSRQEIKTDFAALTEIKN